MPLSEDSLESLRARMDALNGELVALLNRRTETALRIARLKRAAGRPMRDPQRECEILRAVGRSNPGPLPTVTLQRLFAVLLDATVSLMEGGGPWGAREHAAPPRPLHPRETARRPAIEP